MLTRLNAFSFILGSMYVYENIYQTVNVTSHAGFVAPKGKKHETSNI